MLAEWSLVVKTGISSQHTSFVQIHEAEPCRALSNNGIKFTPLPTLREISPIALKFRVRWRIALGEPISDTF